MGFGNFIAGLTAKTLGERQGNGLRAKRAKDLATDPELPQKEYQAARESLLGKDFGSDPALNACTPCAANAKAARRAQRLDLVGRGVQGCPDHAANAARLRSDMDEVEHARLAKHVYVKYDKDAPDDLKVPPPGYLDASPEELGQLGLRQGMLTPEGTDFRAAVYKKDPLVWGEGAGPPYEVVFRGSTLVQEDWDNNFAQNADKESSYYEKAVGIGNAISEKDASENVQIVGHSLGGGLASAAQGGSGAVATTFNAAGLNPQTVARYSKLPDRQQADASKILAYQVEGEVLTSTQEKGMLSNFSNPSVGQRNIVPPSSTELSSDDRHAMDEVIKAIESRKTADETAIKDCLKNKA